MLVRLLITVTRDETARKPFSTQRTHSWCLSTTTTAPLLPSNYIFQRSWRGQGRGKWEERSTKSFRGQYRVQETKREAEKKKREGGAAGANQTGPIMLDMPMTRDHIDRPTLSLFHTLAANKPSWALHTS